MADTPSYLETFFTKIRDERMTHANTATRIGTAFLMLLRHFSDSFLSRVSDDVAAGEIGFMKGFWVWAKGLFGIDQSGNASVNNLSAIGEASVDGNTSIGGNTTIGGLLTALRATIGKISSENYQGGELIGSGWQLTDDDGRGNSRLEVDTVVARMRFIANVLEARKYVALGGNYVYSPASSVIERVDFYEIIEGEPILLGYETIKVPWVLRLMPLWITSRLMSRMKTVQVEIDAENLSHVSFYRCWIKADDGTTRTVNTWKTGMLARCQTMDVAKSEHGDSHTDSDTGAMANTLYWRKVVAVGQGALPVDDGKVHSYVDLSNTGGDYLDGSDIPHAGDNIICYGATEESLSNFIVIETVGPDAPAFKEYRGVGLYDDGSLGINWNLEGKRRTMISPTSGNEFYAPHFYVEITGQTPKDVASFMINTEGLLSEIKGVQQNGKNLLSGTLTGDGWRSCESAQASDDERHPLGISNAWMVSEYPQDVLICTPAFNIESGQKYTLSFDVVPTGPIGLIIEIPGHVYEEKQIPYVEGQTRITATTTGSYTGWCRLYFRTSALRYPQVELGSVATVFEAGVTEISSRIKQTAESIELKVRSDLEAMGIRIDSKSVKLFGGKVDFVGSDNKEYIKVGQKEVVVNGTSILVPYFIFIDPVTGSEAYNLGYGGLSQITSVDASYTLSVRYYLGAAESTFSAYTLYSRLRYRNPVPVYQGLYLWREGYRIVSGNSIVYDVSNMSTPSAWDNKYYTTNDPDEEIDGHPNDGNLIQDGWYASFTWDGYTVRTSAVYISKGAEKSVTIPLKITGGVMMTVDGEEILSFVEYEFNGVSGTGSTFGDGQITLPPYSE